MKHSGTTGDAGWGRHANAIEASGRYGIGSAGAWPNFSARNRPRETVLTAGYHCPAEKPHGTRITIHFRPLVPARVLLEHPHFPAPKARPKTGSAETTSNERRKNTVTKSGTHMDAQVFAAVVKSARLTLSAERTREVAPPAIATLEIIRVVSDVDLKETAPATAFNASWE
jgi:hypothetical protein